MLFPSNYLPYSTPFCSLLIHQPTLYIDCTPLSRCKDALCLGPHLLFLQQQALHTPSSLYPCSIRYSLYSCRGTIILLWAFVKNGYRRLDHHPPTTFQDCLHFHSSGFQSTRSPHSLPTLYDYSLTSTDCTLFYPFTYLIIHYHQPPILALH